MIEQQINLYQERFRPKRTLLSAGQLIVLLVLVLTAMIAYSASLQIEINRAASTSQALKQQQQSVTAQLNAANAELTKLLADTRLDDEISDITGEIRARNRVIEFVESSRFGNGQGFSGYLVSLANLHMDDVWLNEIKLSADYMRIQGSSLKENLVPDYFEQFKHEAMFSGNRFEVFQIHRDAKTDWKVDFEIASRETLDE